ncbi:MAG TPA: hypothetical protein VMU76_07175, partial [Acidimicrobiales bacterium]|nr:hypothetical protein [Acidimicrobiales bacterium]
MTVTVTPGSFASAVADVVERALGIAVAQSESAPPLPMSGSQADREIYNNEEIGPGGAWGRKPVEKAYAVAGAGLLPAASCYLLSLCHLFRQDPMSPFGFQAVSRAVVETSARAWWILAPGIDVRTRVARAAMERWHSAEELGKLASPADSVDQNQSRRLSIRSEMESLGVGEAYEKKVAGSLFVPSTKIVGFDKEVRLASTDLAGKLASSWGISDGEDWYRKYSGA